MPHTEKVQFPGSVHATLEGYLDVPLQGAPKAYAVFAHCFTCNSNFKAPRNVSHALTDQGFAVLRFDFTGLGNSQGDFADTTFSSNVGDLVAAAEFLQEHYEAPKLMIGHSLGGTATLLAAGRVPSVQAVATIGSPADPPHVKHLFEGKVDEIKTAGKAKVNIGGRPFYIKKEFIEDLEATNMEEQLPKLGKSLLILHSPQDTIVEVKNAADLYGLARHPKSFISLDGADHLLSKEEDSLYVGSVISSWARRYVDLEEDDRLKAPEGKVVVSTQQEDGFYTEVASDIHHWVADEPVSSDGTNLGPTPYQLLLSGLGTCTTMTLQMYARRKEWPLKEAVVTLEYEERHQQDGEAASRGEAKLGHFTRLIELKGELDDKQRQRLLEIANKCPVHRTLSGEITIETKLLEA